MRSFFPHPKLGQLEIRNIENEDVSQLTKLLNSAYQRLLDLGLNYNATFQDEDLTRSGLFDGGQVFVVIYDRKIIGTMKIKDINLVDQRKCLYVSRFAVEPQLQSSGIGTYLLKLAETIARRENFECLQLDTAQPAKHLVEYYQSQGFQIIKSIYYEGKTYTSWILQKELPKIATQGHTT